jgi:hypothetical protein
MDQDKPSFPLDGNSAAGLLREIFALDMTSAEISCGSCGVAADVGETRLYGGSMGAIFRCAHCDSIVMRLVRTPSGLWLDMRGSRRLHARPHEDSPQLGKRTIIRA